MVLKKRDFHFKWEKNINEFFQKIYVQFFSRRYYFPSYISPLTKKLRNKKLFKVRSFSGAKVGWMYDHVKPTIWDFNPNHIILHVGTNKLKSSKTASQISRSVTDLALSLKSKTNAVTISLIVTISPIVPRKGSPKTKHRK